MPLDPQRTVPVFVADRINHLQMLAGLPLPAATIGIMANAQTSAQFRQRYRAYPCLDASYCEAIGAPCPCWQEQESCAVRRSILAHTIKMCDSGVFKRGGAQMDYEQLYRLYCEMGAAFGIMIDRLGDRQATLASAEQALRAYGPFRGQFVLVGVAQGTTIEEYLRCYPELKQMGFTRVAVGGLLRKIPGSARYTQVRDEDFMFDVLQALRAEYPEDWRVRAWNVPSQPPGPPAGPGRLGRFQGLAVPVRKSAADAQRAPRSLARAPSR